MHCQRMCIYGRLTVGESDYHNGKGFRMGIPEAGNMICIQLIPIAVFGNDDNHMHFL